MYGYACVCADEWESVDGGTNETHHRLQPSEIISANGFVVSSSPRYAGQEQEYTMERPEDSSA